MRISFEEEKQNAMKAPAISDPLCKSIFATVLNIQNASQCQTWFNETTKKRFGTLLEQHEAAHIYLALGLLQLGDSTLIVQSDGETLTPTKLFHYAGHAFREVGLQNRAADAYWRAGVADGMPGNDFAVRSLARAKSCYGEIGENDKADSMHKLEWEARRALARGAYWILLTAWWLTTAYGTSFLRWLVSLLVMLLGFSISYEYLHSSGFIVEGHPWTVISAVYFCIVTTATVGYGDFTPTNWIGEAIVVANILIGYAMLAFGATILGRKVIGR